MRERFGLAMATGLLLVLLYPPFGFAFLAPLAVAPLGIALAKEGRPLARFGLGYLTGLVLWAGVCWWIAPVLEVHGAMGFWGGWGCFVLFCVLKAIHYGVFGVLGGVLVRQPYGPPAMALLWAVLERTQEPITLFGWLMLGDAGVDLPGAARLAPFTGVHGLSALLALTGFTVAAVLLRRERKIALWGLAACLPIVLPALPEGLPADRSAAIVQPNLPADVDWTPERYRDAKELLSRLTREAIASGPVDAVIWPETPGPMFYASDPDLRARVAELSRAASAPLVLGTIWRDNQGDPRNAALAYPGEIRYEKMFLVPFGEYVPELFSFVNQVSDEAGAYRPGVSRVLMPLGGHNAGTFICYESAVGPHVREFSAAGAEVFLNLSNDGYFFRTPAREQHLQLVRMRAIENRRWVLRATNNGISAAVDPGGRVRQSLPSFQAASGRLGFGYVHEVTLFARAGDWFLWLAAAFVAAALFHSQRPHFTPRPAKAKAERRPE